MKESTFVANFVSHMNNKFPLMWGMKIHGHEMQASSIPDNLFCINGAFVAIEFKVQRDSRISIPPAQIRELTRIQNSKGIALLVAFDEDRKKILFRTTRIDYQALLNKKVKSGNLKLDWDFEFTSYEDSVELIKLMVEGK